MNPSLALLKRKQREKETKRLQEEAERELRGNEDLFRDDARMVRPKATLHVPHRGQQRAPVSPRYLQIEDSEKKFESWDDRPVGPSKNWDDCPVGPSQRNLANARRNSSNSEVPPPNNSEAFSETKRTIVNEVVWQCQSCNQECFPVRDESWCLCGHRKKVHEEKTVRGRVVFSCGDRKCGCTEFMYIVAQGKCL